MRFGGKSLLRKLQYERLSHVTIDGPILDIGGSKHSGYHELIGGDHVITVGNIDESFGLDLLFDAEQPWPLPDGSHNGVLLINVLEHLYRFDIVLSESVRVLQSGGRCIGVVPFMFNVHASPHDYHRFTRAALERHLADAGFSSVHVEELGTGAFSVIYHCLLAFARWRWLAMLMMHAFTTIDRVVTRLIPGNHLGPAYYPLGYYFEAKKQ